MPIRRASAQQGDSLEEFYEEAAASHGATVSMVGKQMLSLLSMLSDICADFDVWGLTSLYDLWLLPSDDPAAPWLVQISAQLTLGYQVRYKMTATEAPWPDAFVEGKAPDEAAACKLILIAMKNSGGWS